MVIPLGYYPQNAVAFIACCPRHVAQWLFAPQAYQQSLSGRHPVKRETGTDECHGTDLAGDVDGVVGRLVGGGHGPNYTPLGRRCRVSNDA